MNNAKMIIDKFGGQSALAALLGKGQTTVQYWVKTGVIPTKWHSEILRLANAHEIDLFPSDFSSKGVTESLNENKNLVAVMPSKGVTLNQIPLNLGIQKAVEIDGIGMGVLSDGTPFLTGRGLALLCGISQKHIWKISSDWLEDSLAPRITKIKEILQSHNFDAPVPYIPIEQRSGTFYAYPDVVCLAILEYYAFDAGNNVKENAKKNYRLLAGKALKDFIYTQVGYDPDNSVPDAWKLFHDRVSLTYNSLPQGYFGVFKEISDMIVTLGQAGLHLNSSFVPDISIGLAWGKHWASNDFNMTYGERTKWEHNYPNYFPQSVSNPQPAWCYPDGALAEFRRWMRENYIGDGKFTKYLNKKVQDKVLPPSFAQLAIAAYTK